MLKSFKFYYTGRHSGRRYLHPLRPPPLSSKAGAGVGAAPNRPKWLAFLVSKTPPALEGLIPPSGGKPPAGRRIASLLCAALVWCATLPEMTRARQSSETPRRRYSIRLVNTRRKQPGAHSSKNCAAARVRRRGDRIHGVMYNAPRPILAPVFFSPQRKYKDKYIANYVINSRPLIRSIFLFGSSPSSLISTSDFGATGNYLISRNFGDSEKEVDQ